MTLDERFIKQTYALALQSAENGFDPFAAILVKDEKEVASTTDHCILNADPTAHAELHLIRTFCQEQQLISLEGYTLYCNVEPCIMCSGAIHWARLSRVVYGVNQSTLKKVSAGKPKPNCRELINSGGSEIEVVGPILEEEGLAVLRAHPFRSKKERFRNYWQER
ncbi:MAG: nucleoside deaminase [Bacteroidota bacterium]